MPHVKKAELVEGIVYMPSSVYAPHGRSHAAIMGWLFADTAATPGTLLFDNTSLRLDARNQFQPDAMLLLNEARGGRCRVSDDGFVQGPPELVIEIAASSAAYDLHSKLRAYQRNGVHEYLAVLIYEQRVVWHRLSAEKYVTSQVGGDGVLRSEVFPGLWLHQERFWANDLTGLLAALHEGLAAPDHAAFKALYSSTSSNPTAIK